MASEQLSDTAIIQQALLYIRGYEQFYGQPVSLDEQARVIAAWLRDPSPGTGS